MAKYELVGLIPNTEDYLAVKHALEEEVDVSVFVENNKVYTNNRKSLRIYNLWDLFQGDSSSLVEIINSEEEVCVTYNYKVICMKADKIWF